MKEPRWPGWYRDSDDPTLLRHWNGHHWDGRRRHLPSWSIATAELRVLDPAAPVLGSQPDGPASPAAIPAAASPTGHTTHPRRLPVPPSGPHGGPLGAADLFPQRAATPTIRRWALPPRRAVAGALVLALLVVTISSALSGAGRRRSSAPFGANSTFAHVANADCAAVMGAVRPATMTTASYKTVGGAAAELDRLAATISALGSSEGLGGGVQRWVADWRAWAAARMAGARSATASPAQRTPSAGTAAMDAKRADEYASAHGLSDCILAAQDVPAIVPVP